MTGTANPFSLVDGDPWWSCGWCNLFNYQFLWKWVHEEAMCSLTLQSIHFLKVCASTKVQRHQYSCFFNCLIFTSIKSLQTPRSEPFWPLMPPFVGISSVHQCVTSFLTVECFVALSKRQKMSIFCLDPEHMKWLTLWARTLLEIKEINCRFLVACAALTGIFTSLSGFGQFSAQYEERWYHHKSTFTEAFCQDSHFMHS